MTDGFEIENITLADYDHVTVHVELVDEDDNVIEAQSREVTIGNV